MAGKIVDCYDTKTKSYRIGRIMANKKGENVIVAMDDTTRRPIVWAHMFTYHKGYAAYIKHA